MAFATFNSVDQVYDELKNEGVDLSTEFSYVHPTKTNNRSKKLSLGRIWFNTILPDNFPLVNEPVDKKKLQKIIRQISEKYEPSEASDYVRNIQKHANMLATFDPRTFQIEMFNPSEEWKESKRKFLEEAPELSLDEFKRRRTQLINSLAAEMQEQEIPFIEALDSKSSGKMNKETWAQLQVSKGMTPDIENNITMIANGISDGYNIEDYYKAAAEARSGFFIKSTAVQQPGYLSRKVVMANANIKLDKQDCGTRKYLELYIDNEKADGIAGRYALIENELKLIEDSSEFLNQTIKIRSPLYCLSQKGICNVCYGKLAESLDTDNIGILAGGAVNNVAVNAFMKLRHQSEKIKHIDVNFIDIIHKSPINIEELNLILNIEEKSIWAKDDIVIEIDRHEYDDLTLNEYPEKYVLPGLITIRHGADNPSYYSLPLNFEVNLFKPNDIAEQGRFLILKYTKDEKVIAQDTYVKGVNPAVITKLFDGTTKYVKDPRVLLDLIYEELPGMDLVHIELTVANMCRDKENKKMPARLNNYRNFEIIGVKNLPFVDSWLNALAFQDINKAIETGLVNEEEATMNDIERLLMRDNYRIDD